MKPASSLESASHFGGADKTQIEMDQETKLRVGTVGADSGY
jgi:hypothetical protein